MSMTITAKEWFEDIDAELALALQMESNAKAVHEDRMATRPVARKPVNRIPARPVKPVLQTVEPVPTAADTPSSLFGGGLPGSERLQSVKLQHAQPAKQLVPPEKPRIRERPTKTDVRVSADGSSKKYLKQSDKDTLNFCSEYKFLTSRHVALLRNSSENYMPRRLNQLISEGFLQKHNDSVGYSVWSLLPQGAKYCGTQLPPLKELPHDDAHFKRENLNTVMAKLAVGVDETILHAKTPGYKLDPSAIVLPRWMEESAGMLQDDKDYLGLRGEQLHQIINDSRHPIERAWKSEREIAKGVPDAERKNLLSLYSNMETAHLLTVLGKDGKPSFELSPDFVILRPMVEATIRADGRVIDYSMNHDACRLETVPWESEELSNKEIHLSLRALLYALYHSRMFGRFHELTDRTYAARLMRSAWDSLIDSGHLPRQEFRSNHPECWLKVHPLPQPLNNTGKGMDAYDEDNRRRALTKADG
jgi:hypothetical protein